jgi:hypothetical protein
MHSNMSRVILMMATLACAIITPAAGVTLLLPSSVFAQQEDTSLGEREDLASGIVSDVLDGSGNADEEENTDDAAGDDTNTQIAVPVTDEDQREANLAANLAAQLDLDVANVDEEEEEEEEPPEFVAFCLQASDFLGEVPVCFNTSEECERAEELLLEVNIDIISDCKGVETLPADAINCFIEEGVTINCTNEVDM